MKIIVLMSSGEKDGHHDVADAVVVDNYLYILKDLEGPAKLAKTYDVKQTILRPAMPDMIITTTYRLLAIYAPNMWMRVEFV